MVQFRPKPQMIKSCEVCNVAFRTKPSEVARGHGRFYGRACAAKAARRGREVECHVCTLKFWRSNAQLAHSKTQTWFCSPDCRSAWNEKVMPSGEEHPGWKGGAKSYRRRAIKKYGAKCSSGNCPLREAQIDVPVTMLDVDHLDDNRANNDLENLQVLCVWCHALKTRADWKTDKSRKRPRSSTVEQAALTREAAGASPAEGTNGSLALR